MHFICSIAAFKARNSYFQSKPFGNFSKSCKIIREQHFCTFDDSCAWLYDKKKTMKTLSTSLRRTRENQSAMFFMRSAVRDRSHS